MIVSREQGWQAAPSSSPSSLRKLQVPIIYPYTPTGAIFMLQLVGTIFNFFFYFFLLFFSFFFFNLPFSAISSFLSIFLVSFLIYLLSFHTPFLPPSSQWEPSMLSFNCVEASGTIFSFSLLQVPLLCYSLYVQSFFKKKFIFLFLKIFLIFPHCLWPSISW